MTRGTGFVGAHGGAGEAAAALAGLPAMLSMPRAARELSVSLRTLQRLTQRWKDSNGKYGLGPVYYVGSKPVIATRTIAEYLEISI